MKSASAGLMALLASRRFFSADLYQFDLVGGGVLRYCSGDQDISWGGHSWSAGGMTGPFFERKGSRARCRWKVGLEVDTLVVDVLPGDANVLGLPFLAAVARGLFDGAEMTLYRAFMPSYGDTAEGTVVMFAGRVAEIEAASAVAVMHIVSHLELLNQKFPRNLYQAGCVNTLFDAACGVNAASYAVSGTVTGVSAGAITATLTQASGYFDLGKIVMTGGTNAGLSRMIKTYVKGTPGTLKLAAGFPVLPQAGDSFTLYPGCDKRQATCSGRFANLRRFRGFPFIPENTTAV